MRMDAYYFGFTPTGIEVVDRILSAVACAGKAYHHTESWTEPATPYEDFLRGATCAEWIQYAAADAASALKAQDEKLARLGEALERIVGLRNALEPISREAADVAAAALADAGAGKGRGDGV